MAISSTSFKPGQSGNPKGKVKGYKDRRLILTQEITLATLENNGQKVLDVITNHALQGNMKAASLFCQYVLANDTAVTIKDERVNNSELEGMLPREKIKAIARIVLEETPNEPQ